MDFKILYADDYLLVIDKPAGIPVLPDGWDQHAPYLVRLLEELYGGPATLSGQAVWVVHRLDKITSGVMVFARTAEAHRALSMQFERQSRRFPIDEAHKVYHAICIGVPKWDEHTARHKLRINVGRRHRTVVDNGKGIPAETHFRVLERYKAHGLVEARPATGRTHQIRVHAYALGHPLLGDSLYSDPAHSPHFEPQNGATQEALIARPALHAFSLTLTHPLTNERLTFEAPYPADFAQALSRLRT
jgi:RluA family pseudouridine synthase